MGNQYFAKASLNFVVLYGQNDNVYTLTIHQLHRPVQKYTRNSERPLAWFHVTSLSLWRDVWDGFEGWTAHWIRNWLEGLSQRTVTKWHLPNGSLGNGLHQVEVDHRWCPQGSALGPELFNVYQWHGCWKTAHPQQDCLCHQAVWCSWHNRMKGCHPEGPGQAWKVGPNYHREVQQDQVQGFALLLEQSQVWVKTARTPTCEQPCWEGLRGSGR